MGLLKHSRIIQNHETRQNNAYILQNSKLENQLVVSRKARDFLLSYKEKQLINLLPSNFLFLSELKNRGFWDNNSEKESYICADYNGNLLSSLNIELTNACNLNCVHCYGSYGLTNIIREITLSQIESILGDLENLNTSDVTLTGGECFLAKDFQQIALAFLKRGINLWIMTNGMLVNKIKSFIQATIDYKYAIKVSLDGLKTTHNKIRQNPDSFDRIIQTLDFISNHNNIRLYISTVIMKDNLEELSDFRYFVKKRYPTAIHSMDFIFSAGNAKKDSTHGFSLQELKSLENKHPELFTTKGKNTNTGLHRCTAGISQATIKADGTMKICNIADNDIFYFKHNVFEKGLKTAWEDCGSSINYFRREEKKATTQCQHCAIKSSCDITDCRVHAWLLTKSAKNSSPISCLLARSVHETTT